MKKSFFVALFVLGVSHASLKGAMTLEVPQEKIEMIQKKIDTADFKDDLIMSYDDRMLFRFASQDPDSEAGKLYKRWLQLFEELPSHAEMARGKNWAEALYAEHEYKKARQKQRAEKR